MSFLKKWFGKKEKEDSNRIGSADIIWYANKEAVSQLTSMGAASGLNLREVVSVLMGKEGSRDDLITSANRISLSPARKRWCETTPIYRQKNGGIYVLSEKVDDDTRKKKKLELLGMIEAKDYAGVLCAAHGIDAANVFV